MSRIKLTNALKQLAMAGCATIAMAHGINAVQENSVKFNITSHSLAAALNAYGLQSNQEVFFKEGELQGLPVQPLQGLYNPKDALQTLLDASGVEYRINKMGTILVGSVASDVKLGFQKIAYNTTRDYEASLAVAEEDETVDDVNAFELDEIVVTATRRETSVQSTALTISAFGGKGLEEKGYNSITQFIDTVPGVTSNDEGGGSNTIIIRNINTSTQEAGSASVATYFNDFALSTTGFSTAADIRLVDVNRVEVLKGPQGTLFGRSAMGGIVRYIANKPNTDAFEGGINTYLSDTADGGSNYGGHGYLNVPVSDNFAVRMVGYYYDNAGFVDNVELGIDDINEEKTWGGRFAAHWDVTDTLSADFTYLYQKQNAGPNSVTTTRDPGDLNVAGDEGPDVPFDLNARTAIGGVVEERNSTYEFFNFKLEKDFGDFTTTFLATRSNADNEFAFDQREFVNFRAGCACDTPVDDVPRGTEVDILELRFVSSNDSFLDWIFGLYYEDEESAIRQLNIYLGPDQVLFGLLPFSDGTVGLDTIASSTGEEQAAYGELGFNFSPETKLTVGYRRSHVEFGTLTTQSAGVFNAFNGSAALVGIPFETSENVNTFKFSLEHQINDDLFAYATATSGYRRGGFNLPTAISEFSTFDSDTLWNYELGLKSTWLDGRLIANLSAYLIDYTDIQLTVQDPVTFGRTTQNVGKAEVTGLEFSMVFQATEALNLSFNGSLSDPKLKEDVPGGVTGKEGDRLPGSAKKSFAITADWEKPLNDDLSLYGIVTYKYVGERLNDFNLDLDVALPSYDLMDARIGLRSADGYSISLFANNLFDKKILYGIDRQGAFFESAKTNRPRTIGINLTYDF